MSINFRILSSLLVTPYVGVWIEIGIMFYFRLLDGVTPYVGVWIEISKFS